MFPLVFLLFLPAITTPQITSKSSVTIPVSTSVLDNALKNMPFTADTGQITFQVDMSQWAAKGKFNPATDSMDVPGTFNNWKGSALLQKLNNSMVYQISLYLDSLSVQQFRFRINRDSTRMEFPNAISRLFRVPGHTLTVSYKYNDYDTTTVPMTFKCHMAYQIKAHHFNQLPYNDYLDVAGSMNNWGAYDVLFDNPVDTLKDSIYQIKLNIPRTSISTGVPIDFKFRINGNWNTSEFPNGGPFRSYFLHDTTGGNQNLVDVWYDDENPSILMPPWAYNLFIQGEYFVGQTLTGSYTYEDVNLKHEGKSIYRWYRADSLTQVNPELRTADTTVNYVLDSTDFHKFIAFQVTPVANGTGDSLVGKPVMTWTGLIGGVGFAELNGVKPGIYPNPVTNQIYFTNIDNIKQIEIYSILGQKVYFRSSEISNKIIYDASSLEKGIYFVKFTRADQSFSTVKFIKK